MADDTEKRLHSIMDKLFHTPKNSRSSSVQIARGLKRPHSMILSKSKGNKSERDQDISVQALPCRPWDRGDLMRRLATFKSMTWFAKPKVIDAVSCARRGWINVDMDIIACAVCGVRLLFITPASWNKQQVEKAASVFSLKLDNGHKLLCPWIDNCCDETLALFPPTPAEVLVEHYKERSSALMQLLALPVISASAVESMKTPQLEQFLKQSIAVEFYKNSDGSSCTLLGNDCEAVLAASYFQAHRLLSLCGWEPRLVPYIVDCNEGSKQSTNTGPSAFSQATTDEQNSSLTVYSSGSGEKSGAGEESLASDVQYDPSSTVLDCKFCGASVGLWTFALVSRPLEVVRVVGYTEVDSRSNLGNDDHGVRNNAANGSNTNREAMLSKGSMTKLNMTIAGGPPPTQQNFRAKISLPVIGRNLRAQFSSGSSIGRNVSETRHTSTPSTECAKESFQDVEAASNQGDMSSHVVEEAGKSNQVSGKLSVQESSSLITRSHQNVEMNNGEVDGDSDLQQMERNEMVSAEQMSTAASDSRNENSAGKTRQSASKDACSLGSAKDLKGVSINRKMEFDPLRQHRHFCPWVASTETIAPGWKQTLFALQKEKVFALTESEDSPMSPSLIKVDDPITSIRRLFKSPSTKIMKAARQSK